MKKWLNGYWRNRFGLLRQGNDMGWVMMMRVMSSATSPALAAPDWPHTYLLGIFILFSGAFGRLTIFFKEAQSQRIKILFYFIVPWGTHRELVNTPWTHHVLHLFLVERGTLFMGDLVHFGTLWLYWSMYCMLSSSQPLIRIFYLLILATHFESG